MANVGRQLPEGTIRIMVSEVYDALIEADASPEKARAAAEAIPAPEQLATKQDLARSPRPA